MYVSNHLSYMDTPVVLNKLPFQFRILARHDLFKIPFIGWYLQRSGQIPVDSTSLRSTLASLNRGVKALQAGMPLMIFPEGGRSVEWSSAGFSQRASLHGHPRPGPYRAHGVDRHL